MNNNDPNQGTNEMGLSEVKSQVVLKLIIKITKMYILIPILINLFNSQKSCTKLL